MTKLDPFTRSYIETILWAETGGPNGDTPLDRDYSAEDFDPKTLARIIAVTARSVHRNDSTSMRSATGAATNSIPA